MKNSQNQNISKVQKDDVTRKSPTLFIQLGLVLALLVSYLAIESKTFIGPTVVAGCPTGVTPEDEFIPEIPENEELVKVKPLPEVDLDKFDIVKDDVPTQDKLINSTEDGLGEKVKIKITDIPNDIPNIIEPPFEDVPFLIVEEAPIYPGCKGTKEALKKCFSEKVQKLVNDKFNMDLANELGLEPGKQRIHVMFKIDKTGIITDVQARAPHKSLEAEAVRVVNLLPQMTPGKQRMKPVGVKYTLPIVFEIQ